MIVVNQKKKYFSMCKPLKSIAGFSLIELMVVLSIAAILLMVSMPSFVDSSAKGKIRAGINELATDLAFARSTAVTRPANVSICASDISVTPRACGNGAWNEGWLVFVDVDGDGVIDTGDELVRITEGMGNMVAVSLDNAVTFNKKGQKSNVSEFKFCNAGDKDAHFARALLVNIGGLVRRSRDTDDDGIHNTGETGGNLSCP
ncbi:type IV fimbrial biogenesis protein FimT [Alteromonadaceae bacterium Bs31]|nr:type IV fimbrial biogenesis protein FimT [Alteromonadaceae bacterium Bs31]